MYWIVICGDGSVGGQLVLGVITILKQRLVMFDETVDYLVNSLKFFKYECI